MMYVFDACSILNLIKRACMKPFLNGVTLDLAFYECLNAIWREHVLLGKLDADTALEYVGLITDTFKVLHVVSFGNLGGEVYKLAVEEEITVYDAAYLLEAMRGGCILVTDDEKLEEVSRRYVKVVRSSSFCH
ncbi:MAG TPA: DNA-binding protein [Thermoprotei archaeon]|nr:DNA-binding protein [Thermoprotei archaeon]